MRPRLHSSFWEFGVLRTRLDIGIARYVLQVQGLGVEGDCCAPGISLLEIKQVVSHS
jgi:hypothetical protein